MAKKKSTQKKAAPKKTTMFKIGKQVGHLAQEVAAGKDYVVEKAGDAIKSVKSTIQNITSPKKAKPAVKKAAKKLPAKKAIKKVVKATVKKVVKKAAPVKKVIKKAAKKVVSKK